VRDWGAPTWAHPGSAAPCSQQSLNSEHRKEVLLAVVDGPAWTRLLQEIPRAALAHAGLFSHARSYRSGATPQLLRLHLPAVMARSAAWLQQPSRSWDGMACEVPPICSGQCTCIPDPPERRPALLISSRAASMAAALLFKIGILYVCRRELLLSPVLRNEAHKLPYN